MIGVLLSLVAAAAFLGMVVRAHDARLVPFAGVALVMHLASAFAQLWINESYYGVSDVFFYAEYGKLVAHTLDVSFVRFGPEVVKLALHMDADMQLLRFETGDSSTTMIAFTGMLFYFLGTSLLASFLVVSIIAWIGQVLLAMTLGKLVNDDERPLAYLSALLVPSVVFWSSAIVKEGFVMSGLGLLCYSVHRVVIERRFVFILGIPMGAVVVAMLKPYVLFPFILGLGAWVFVNQFRLGRLTFRPSALVLSAVVAVGGLVLMTRLFPEFAIDRLGERTAMQQQAWGDSDTSGLDIGEGANASLASQLPFIPLALVNTLFRPFIFEARSITTLAAALETTLLIVLSAQILVRVKYQRLRQIFLTSPLLSSSAVFVLVFSIAIGLATKNLGSLSRYRMPMIPFYVLTVLLLRRRLLFMRRAGDETNEADSEGEMPHDPIG